MSGPHLTTNSQFQPFYSPPPPPSSPSSLPQSLSPSIKQGLQGTAAFHAKAKQAKLHPRNEDTETPPAKRARIVKHLAGSDGAGPSSTPTQMEDEEFSLGEGEAGPSSEGQKPSPIQLPPSPGRSLSAQAAKLSPVVGSPSGGLFGSPSPSLLKATSPRASPPTLVGSLPPGLLVQLEAYKGAGAGSGSGAGSGAGAHLSPKPDAKDLNKLVPPTYQPPPSPMRKPAPARVPPRATPPPAPTMSPIGAESPPNLNIYQQQLLSAQKEGFVTYNGNKVKVKHMIENAISVRGSMMEVFVMDGNQDILIKCLHAARAAKGDTLFENHILQRQYVKDNDLTVAEILNLATAKQDGILIVRRVPDKFNPQMHWGEKNIDLAYDEISDPGRSVLDQLKPFFELAAVSLKDNQILDLLPNNFKLANGVLTELDFREEFDDEDPEGEHFSTLVQALKQWMCGNRHVRDYLVRDLPEPLRGQLIDATY